MAIPAHYKPFINFASFLLFPGDRDFLIRRMAYLCSLLNHFGTWTYLGGMICSSRSTSLKKLLMGLDDLLNAEVLIHMEDIPQIMEAIAQLRKDHLPFRKFYLDEIGFPISPGESRYGQHPHAITDSKHSKCPP